MRTSATGAFFRSMLRRGVSGALGGADAASGVRKQKASKSDNATEGMSWEPRGLSCS